MHGETTELLVIVVMIFVLIWIGIIGIGIKKFANAGRVVRTGSSPKGIGGWLLFLIFSLIFIRPFFEISLLNSDFMDIEKKFPNIVGSGNWGSFKTANWLYFTFTYLIGIYAGWVLIKGKNFGAVKKAVNLIGIYAFLIGAGYPLMLMMFLHMSDLDKLISAMFTSLFFAGVWITYLLKSKRVRATYGESVYEEDIPKVGVGGFTELMFHSGQNNLNEINKMVNEGVNVNQQDEQGATALIYAVLNNRAEIVRILLSHDADTSLSTYKSGQTAMSIAKKKDFQDIISLLTSYDNSKLNGI